MPKILLLLAAAVGPAPAASAAADGPAPPFAQTEGLDDLLDRVKEERDRVSASVFRRIARHRNEQGLKALEQAIGYLRGQAALDRAYGAAVHFVSPPELREDAIEFLDEDARKHRRRQNQLAAARALASIGEPAYDELRRIAQDHDEPVVRRTAMLGALDALAVENSEDAAEIIVENVDLRLPGQRERVAAALAKMGGEDVVEYFVQSVEDDDLLLEVRILLLETLADREDPEVDALVIDLMNARATQLQFRAVEMVGERRVLDAESYLSGLVDAREDYIVRAAILALGRLRGQDPAWQQDVYEFGESRRMSQRMGAAAALGLLRNDDALERLHRLMSDPERSVRIEALQSIGNLRQKASIPTLIARLGREKGRLEENIATTLRLFSGLDLGTLPSTWQRWWDAEGEESALPPYEEALAAEQARAEKRANSLTQSSFYGLRVVSDRVVFVMDVSGSMDRPAHGRGGRSSSDPRGGRTRLAVAQEELKRVLERMPDGDWFNLIFFAGSVRPWLDELEEMEEEAREDATAFVDRQNANGGTAIYDALERAFEDEQIDTIYLLSDGAPSAGAVIDPGSIRFEVQRWNAIRKIQINTVSVGQASELLEWLAEDSGGRYVEVL